MAFVTADVVPNPGGSQPFKVVFKQGENVLGEWEVASKAVGEEEIVEMIEQMFESGDEEDDAPAAPARGSKP